MSNNIRLSPAGSMILFFRVLMLIALAAAGLTACAPPVPPPASEPVPPEPAELLACVDFEDQSPGAVYVVPNTFIASGISIQVLQFQWSDGTWTSTGPGVSVMDNMPNKTTNTAMFVNNVNLGFYLESTECLTIQYCELGGNVNLIINGITGNEDDFQAFDGVDFNGVRVSVNKTDDQYNCGTIRLEGLFEKTDFQEQWPITFAIGGQELYIDEICPCE